VNVVEAHPPAGHDWSGISPLFNAEEMEMGPFLQRWLELSTSAPMIAAAAAPRAGARVMQGSSRTSAMPSSGCTRGSKAPRPVTLRRGPGDPGRNDRLRFHLPAPQSGEALMAQTGKETLEHKLARLAGMLGEESAAWLLGSPNNWAYTVMRLRNSLTHGLLVPGHDDVRLLGDAVLTLKVVPPARAAQSLRLHQRLCPVPGEMLRAAASWCAARGTRSSSTTSKISHRGPGQWSERARSLRGAGGGHAGS